MTAERYDNITQTVGNTPRFDSTASMKGRRSSMRSLRRSTLFQASKTEPPWR